MSRDAPETPFSAWSFTLLGFLSFLFQCLGDTTFSSHGKADKRAGKREQRNVKGKKKNETRCQECKIQSGCKLVRHYHLGLGTLIDGEVIPKSGLMILFGRL
ncbi:hypothetical protein TWF225_002508 [Orbilia oligospora]|uniref:Uncharacterized protein n=1 Tax=Orbilia oligospora TaxID=2813651 RepID=A0A7C8PQT3_ORBOL|nr:hypothetical protein TWF751_004695 [Orbilia oligospora]KAF3190009.1 hypothetical protein TWF225_002508 [Orbilia oligospora]KAF3266250.1 hypothetical protein TWF217_001926 [Orbilia oligospora]KAF3268632.1 hypothetical protein TWF128_007013 [Orbilia oligospora]KAF3297096.1 hypothetical protein TWF132_008456 [Orbilia oligospora]